VILKGKKKVSQPKRWKAYFKSGQSNQDNILANLGVKKCTKYLSVPEKKL
jgi:hypothetical protein